MNNFAPDCLSRENEHPTRPRTELVRLFKSGASFNPMTTQLTFETAASLIHSGALSHHIPCQFHSATSRAAAVAILSRAEVDRLRVRNYLISCGNAGATDEEIQDALKLGGNTERPRRRGLVRDGSVFDSGKTRKTKSGCDATVWTVMN